MVPEDRRSVWHDIGYTIDELDMYSLAPIKGFFPSIAKAKQFGYSAIDYSFSQRNKDGSALLLSLPVIGFIAMFVLLI